MDYLVELSLTSVLVRKIYATDIALVRNDSKASDLVFRFVNRVVEQLEEGRDSKDLSLEDAERISYEIQPLIGLSQHTIRKYISELWVHPYHLRGAVTLHDPGRLAFDIRRFRRA